METVPQLTEEGVNYLRTMIKDRMSSHRYQHTLGVEKTIVQMGEIYMPNDILRLRVAALLHDITKDFVPFEHRSILSLAKVAVPKDELQVGAILHAKSAVPWIKEYYAEYVDAEIMEAISLHSTGAENMTLMTKLLFMADYIEDGRTYDDCVKVRAIFWEKMVGLRENDYEWHLDRTLVLAIELLLKELLSKDAKIALATVKARNCLLDECKQNKYVVHRASYF